MSTIPVIPRYAQQVLDDNLVNFPAVMIGGARAVGKTTTAAQRAKSFVSLDDPAVREPFLANPDVVLRTYMKNRYCLTNGNLSRSSLAR